MVDFKDIIKESEKIRAMLPNPKTQGSLGIWLNEDVSRRIYLILKDIRVWNYKADRIIMKMEKGTHHKGILKQILEYKGYATALQAYYGTILNEGRILDENQRRRIWLENANLSPVC